MARHCCVAGPAPHRPALRFSRAMASILALAMLVFLPKCPFCVAAWLTIATGISFSATGAVWIRTSVVLLWIAVLLPVILGLVFSRIQKTTSGSGMDAPEQADSEALSHIDAVQE